MSFLHDRLHEPAQAERVDRELADFLWPDVNERRQPQFVRPGESRDAELVELVGRFERLYAELMPPPEPQTESQRDDALVVEVPDDVPAEENRRWVTATEAEAPHAPDYAPASAGDPPLAVDYRRPERAMPPDDPAPRRGEESAPAAFPETGSEETQDWSASARQALWPRLLIAATALAVGIAAGYVGGKTSGSIASGAKIQATPDGGARLRFDYDLHRR